MYKLAVLAVAQWSETPKKLVKSQKNLDMAEILHIKVFGVAEFENEGKSKTFKMAHLKWPTYFSNK